MLYRKYKLHEVVEIIQATEDSCTGADVFVEPPVEGDVSEQDSADEDNSGSVDNLSRRQLLSDAEAVIHNINGDVLLGAIDEEGEENLDNAEVGPTHNTNF